MNSAWRFDDVTCVVHFVTPVCFGDMNSPLAWANLLSLSRSHLGKPFLMADWNIYFTQFNKHLEILNLENLVHPKGCICL